LETCIHVRDKEVQVEPSYKKVTKVTHTRQGAEEASSAETTIESKLVRVPAIFPHLVFSPNEHSCPSFSRTI
jgi:hypothetical protein